MSYETLNLLENITASGDAQAVFYSDKNRGAGYYKKGDGVHTVLFHTEGFVGTITIQATLELYPSDADWFDVYTETFALDSSNSNRSTTITGNFVFIRTAYTVEDGEIISVRYNC